jgi:hypothetical protein
MSAEIMEHIVNETMTDAEKGMLENALSQAHIYLEYGAGVSTCKAADFSNITSITSVESDAEFVKTHVQTNASVLAAQNAGVLRLILVDLGPTKQWGYPVDSSKKYMWPGYALSPYTQGYVPDTILIDGRFRIACALAAALQAPDAAVLIHDYKIRPNYFLLERFFNVDASADTMVKLSLKKNADKKSIARLLKKYVNRPGDECISWALFKKKLGF